MSPPQERHHLALPQGPLEYLDQGSGPPVVMLHGLLSNAHLWDELSAGLPDLRLLRPFLPLGAHTRPMPPDADLTLAGVARLVAAFLDALDLRDVTLLGNDTGGVVTQLLMAHHPQRIGRVVLTNTDSFDLCPPPMFQPLVWAGHLPAALHLLRLLEIAPVLGRLPSAYGHLSLRPLPPALQRAFIAPSRNARIRRDLARVLRGVHPRVTIEVSRHLEGFTPPVLIVWGEDDRVFPVAYGHALAHLLPNAELVRVPGRTFHILESPDPLAHALRAFIDAPTLPALRGPPTPHPGAGAG